MTATDLTLRDPRRTGRVTNTSLSIPGGTLTVLTGRGAALLADGLAGSIPVTAGRLVVGHARLDRMSDRERSSWCARHVARVQAPAAAGSWDRLVNDKHTLDLRGRRMYDLCGLLDLGALYAPSLTLPDHEVPRERVPALRDMVAAVVRGALTGADLLLVTSLPGAESTTCDVLPWLADLVSYEGRTIIVVSECATRANFVIDVPLHEAA